MSEFYDLGAHCTIRECREKDFLPFECDLCHQKFCLKHRSYKEHNCAFYEEADKNVPVCPICQQIIPVQPSENVDAIVNEHIQKGCPKISAIVTERDLNLTKEKKKELKGIRYCGMEGCTKKGIIRCKFCGRVHCIEHRLDSDHECKGARSQKKKGIAGNISSSTIISNIKSGITDTYSNVNNKLAELHKQREERRERKQRLEIAKAVKSGDYKKQRKVLQNSFSNKKYQPIGQSTIEFEDRFPLDVYFPMKSKVPPVHMFFHRNWKCGRVLDQIARQGKIDNNNNVTLDEEKRLNLFNISSTELLHPSKTLQELRDEGSLEPGDGVILEYGPVLDPAIPEAFQKAVQNPNEINCGLM
jgi:predicted nucleic acid binding AN1-type Zn finger protein